MTRETRQYLSRVRKAQDAIMNHKATDGASLAVECDIYSDGVTPIITVSAWLNKGSKLIKSAYAHFWPAYSVEEFEADLAKCSQVIGYEI